MRFSFFKKRKKKPKFTLAFYNLENLFDPEDHAHTLDNDFTPDGYKEWTPERYKDKLQKLARTISRIGATAHGHPPVLVGLAEVENDRVIKDLLRTAPLAELGYGYVHYESPDERGIDTALIYRKRYFKASRSEALPLQVLNPDGQQDTTRDILVVSGHLNGEALHVYVNHWPSRRDGSEETAYKRMAAAQVVNTHMNDLEDREGTPNVVVMGDFNDNPSCESVRALLDNTPLFNPMEKLHIPKQRGSAHYKGRWSLFDQVLLSHSFFDHRKGTHSFDSAHIFDDGGLKEKKGKYKGNPFRTYAGGRYLGGYSDHFPVYVILDLNL